MESVENLSTVIVDNRAVKDESVESVENLSTAFVENFVASHMDVESVENLSTTFVDNLMKIINQIHLCHSASALSF